MSCILNRSMTENHKYDSNLSLSGAVVYHADLALNTPQHLEKIAKGLQQNGHEIYLHALKKGSHCQVRLVVAA